MLVERGLARSRTQAQQLLRAGQVLLNGEQLTKRSQLIHPTSELTVVSADHYVSRAAHKLIAALDAFQIPVSGQHCLDLGTSTGGFTQVLLERGAAHVLGIEVGHGQLAAELQDVANFDLLEGFNARELSQATVTEGLGDHYYDYRPELVVGDLSFISLRYVLPNIADYAAQGAQTVLLVKPQFEVGRTRVRGGIVTERADRIEAIIGVCAAAAEVGLHWAGLHPSPIRGSNGNYEYLLWLNRTSTTNQAELEERVAFVTHNEA